MQPNIAVKFAEYVVWICLCKHCEFGERNLLQCERYRIFPSGYFWHARSCVWLWLSSASLSFPVTGVSEWVSDWSVCEWQLGAVLSSDDWHSSHWGEQRSSAADKDGSVTVCQFSLCITNECFSSRAVWLVPQGSSLLVLNSSEKLLTLVTVKLNFTLCTIFFTLK